MVAGAAWQGLWGFILVAVLYSEDLIHLAIASIVRADESCQPATSYGCAVIANSGNSMSHEPDDCRRRPSRQNSIYIYRICIRAGASPAGERPGCCIPRQMVNFKRNNGEGCDAGNASTRHADAREVNWSAPLPSQVLRCALRMQGLPCEPRPRRLRATAPAPARRAARAHCCGRLAPPAAHPFGGGMRKRRAAPSFLIPFGAACKADDVCRRPGSALRRGTAGPQTPTPCATRRGLARR
jgi:hypothetical protein